MKYGEDRTDTRMARRPMMDKYDLENILYGIRQLHQTIRQQPGFDYERNSLRNAIRILSHNMPRRARKDYHQTYYEYRCPRCGHLVNNYFCAECGQRIYWKWGIRPFDDKRRQTEYRHHDMDYVNLQERREIEWYIRIHGLQWVLDKCTMADRKNQPIESKIIGQWAKDVEYQPGDDMTEYDDEFEQMIEARKEAGLL